MPERLGPKLLSWAPELEELARAQAERTAALPVVAGHVALMPDAHWGLGATVGSVIPTEAAVIPAAVGVDIGCGMVASRVDIAAGDLPDDLDPWLGALARAIPAGVGRGHDEPQVSEALDDLMAEAPVEDAKERRRAVEQFGSLGSGNHFVELCLDERDRVWFVLHSGSRGIGNRLATRHIQRAKGLMKERMESLEDPDLAYFVEGTPEFAEYLQAMKWSQRYAFANRARMTDNGLDVIRGLMGRGVEEVERINCHHNFTEQEEHGGRRLWITRKGAIRAGEGDRGVIPGSMGTSSYIVTGLGNEESWQSCAHGAGRRMGRKEARRRFTGADLERAMGGRVWRRDQARALVDEIPGAYKDIDEVMEAQKDLVRVDHVLHQVLNYKGT
jgi:tRNA-splicing ligase RtcB